MRAAFTVTHLLKGSHPLNPQAFMLWICFPIITHRCTLIPGTKVSKWKITGQQGGLLILSCQPHWLTSPGYILLTPEATAAALLGQCCVNCWVSSVLGGCWLLLQKKPFSSPFQKRVAVLCPSSAFFYHFSSILSIWYLNSILLINFMSRSARFQNLHQSVPFIYQL